MRLDGKVAVGSGAGSGIGPAAAMGRAARGVRVMGGRSRPGERGGGGVDEASRKPTACLRIGRALRVPRGLGSSAIGTLVERTTRFDLACLGRPNS